MNNLVQDLQATITQYFGPINAGLFLLLRANQEMPLESLITNVCSFKNQTKRRQFQASTFDYSQFELDQRPDDTAEHDRSRQTQICENLIINFIEGITPKYQDLQGNPSKTFLKTGIQDEMNSLLYQLKENQLLNGERDARFKSKTEYLKQLIMNIFEKCSKEPDEEVAEKIIKYGAVEIAFAYPLFSGDQSFRIRFKKILYNCKTFKELRIYGGEDISFMKSALVKQLSLCLVVLKIDERTSQGICEKLLENPLSHIVALHPHLTKEEKDKFYQSTFYSNSLLFSYAQKVQYRNSLEYLVKDDIMKILTLIQNQLKVTNQILFHVLDFNLFQLFKVDALRNIKKSVFKTIIQSCPNYLKAFRLVHYQNKTKQSLKEDESINQKILLTKIFLEIHLPYDEFQQAETAILQRKYQQIDKLNINSSARYALFKHVFEVVEPYFRRKQKMTDYRSQIQLILLQEIMKTDISNLTFQKISLIAEQTLDDPSFQSTQADDLSPSDKKSYKKVIENQQFVKYKKNNRQDIEEVNYFRRIQLIKQIYLHNFEEEINVSYDKISKFVDFVIEEGRDPTEIGKIAIYLSTLTTLPQKKRRLIKDVFQPEEKIQEKIIEIIEEQKDNEETLNRRLVVLINQFVGKYTSENQESWFEKLLKDKFAGDKVAFVKKLVETKSFENQASPFYESLGVTNFAKNNIKAQFSRNFTKFASFLMQITQIMSQLNITNLTNQPTTEKQFSREQLEEVFKKEANSFYENYTNLNEDSYLAKLLNDKYGQDIAKLVKECIEERAFESPDSPFFEKHGYSKFIVRAMIKEFQKNAQLGKNLKEQAIKILQKIE